MKRRFISFFLPKSLKIKFKSFFSCLSLKKNYSRIKKKKRIGAIPNIVFLIQYPEMWNSCKTVYNSLVNSHRCNVFLLTIPKRSQSDIFAFEKTNDAYIFLKSEKIDAIDGFKNNVLFNISSLKPDYIFVQRPYDRDRPSSYSLKNLSKKAFLCYIPYNGRMTRGIHLDTELRQIVYYFHIFFADCTDSEAYANDRIKYMLSPKIRKVYCIGFPRFDLIPSLQAERKRAIKTVLWTPRWSVEKHNNISHFYDYFDCLMDYFEKHQEYFLIIRPHPFMFSNFLKTGYKTQSEIMATLSRIESLPNVSIDGNKDYLTTFKMSDMLISDATSLLLEYFFFSRPVILLDDLDPLTSLTSKIVGTFYYANNKDSLIALLNELVSGSDPKNDGRFALLQQLKISNCFSGNSIANVLLSDYYDE